MDQGEIDLLIGARDVPKIMRNNDSSLSFFDSKFGKIFLGSVDNNTKGNQKCLLTDKKDLISQEQDFSEELKVTNDFDETFEEKFCEDYFMSTTEIAADGGLIVRLPFKPGMSLGENYKVALSRFFNLERTLSKNEQLSHQYHENIKEMIETKQVALVKDGSKGKYYLPHHAVIKHSSTTHKCRIVFDGSCVTSNLKSINHVLFTGKKLQIDLQQTLLAFRLKRIGVTADVKRMFHMVKIHPDERCYVRFFYRTPLEKREDKKVR